MFGDIMVVEGRKNRKGLIGRFSIPARSVASPEISLKSATS